MTVGDIPVIHSQLRSHVRCVIEDTTHAPRMNIAMDTRNNNTPPSIQATVRYLAVSQSVIESIDVKLLTATTCVIDRRVMHG
jgi:hypothetical protein